MNRPDRLVKRGFAMVFGLMLISLSAMGQIQSTYQVTGNLIYVGAGFSGNTVSSSPNINATNFVNNGFVELLSYPLPFQTEYTLNYTNNREMVGAVGWEFDYGTPNGRSMAASFYNGNFNPSTFPAGGYIESESLSLPNPDTSGSIPLGYSKGYLWVSATNIVNRGLLAADASSEIMLSGSNVDLSRGSLTNYPIVGAGSSNTKTNFTADTAIYDEYWWQTNLTPALFDSAALWDGTNALSAAFDYAAPCGTTGKGFSLGFVPTVADSFTNASGYAAVVYTNSDSPTDVQTNVFPTNLVFQAVFVDVADSNITATTGFTPTGLLPGTLNPNPFDAVGVQLTSPYGTLQLVDSLASELADGGGRGLLPNLVVSPAAECSGKTYRPTNYVAARTGLVIGTPGFGLPPTNFLYDSSWFNPLTNSIYSDYSFFADNEASEPPSSPGNPNTINSSSVTNLPGRVHIYAGNLNLFDTQMRAEGEVVIQAHNLKSSQNASIDCENLSYNLGATNGNLNVTNLASTSVSRFHGNCYVWSAVWSNLTVVITPNFGFSNVVVTNNGVVGSNSVPFFDPITNFVHVGLSDTMLDASQLSSVAPVSVFDLLLHSTNMVISDSMDVIQTFLLDGTSFTLDGNLTFPGTAPIDPVSLTPFSGNPIQSWVYTMAPNLLYFTNNGSLTIPQDANFGNDGPTNYLVFVNNGYISAADQTIDSVNLQINNGTNNAQSGDFTVTAGTAVFSNAQIYARGSINIFANSLMIDPSQLYAESALNLYVTNLSDAGVGSDNTFLCQNGFTFGVTPNTGNLWGTTVYTLSYGDDIIDHYWSGQDFGASATGYTNNAAIFDLVLYPQDVSPPRYPLFYFSGTGADNGLYVGTLDLSYLGTNITDMLEIDPSLTIYYSHALLGFVPPGGVAPEVYLNGMQFPPGSGGYLRYVKGFNVLPVAVVRAAAPTPKLSASYLKSKGQFNLTLAATPGQSYVIQASTNLVNWVPIFTNTTPVSGLIQFLDSSSPGYRSRFYRAVSGP